MKNNVLALFIAIFAPFISFSTNPAQDFNQDTVEAMKSLLLDISQNSKLRDFCNNQTGNKQCRVINNAINHTEQIKKIYYMKPTTGSPFLYFIKKYLLFHQMDHLKSQLYSNSHYASLERNYRELCSQIKEQKKQS